jgi:hypothetical protein
MKIFRWILLHISSILAIVFITFYVLDYYNPFMNYLANPLSKTLILVLGIVTIISNELIVFDWLKGQKKEQKNGQEKEPKESQPPVRQTQKEDLGEIEEL